MATILSLSLRRYVKMFNLFVGRLFWVLEVVSCPH